MILYVLDAARYELTSKFATALDLDGTLFPGRKYGFDLTVTDCVHSTKCVLMPTSDNNKLFNSGLIVAGQMVSLSKLSCADIDVSRKKKKKRANSTQVLEANQNTERCFFVGKMVLCQVEPKLRSEVEGLKKLPWHPATSLRLQQWTIPIVPAGRAYYLPPVNTDIVDGMFTPFHCLPRDTPAGGSVNGAWRSEPPMKTLVARGKNGPDHLLIDPSCLLQCTPLAEAIASLQKCPRVRTSNGIAVGELDMKDALVGRVVRKSRLVHYGKYEERMKKVCPYLFKFEMTDASLLGCGSGRPLKVTCWDHVCPQLYHRLEVGSVIVVWGYRWNEYKGNREIKLNAGQSLVVRVNLDVIGGSGDHNDTSGSESESGKEEEEEDEDDDDDDDDEEEEDANRDQEQGNGRKRTSERQGEKRKKNTKRRRLGTEKNAVLENEENPAVQYVRQRLLRPPMNFVETSYLEYVPHRARFDFVGLLTYVGYSRRTRHVSRRRRKEQEKEKESSSSSTSSSSSSSSSSSTGQDETRDDEDENPTEEDSMSTLYDPTTGLLRDAATDASFSEWRWCVLRDATSQRQLSIKLFTNSRTKGCSILETHVGKVVVLSDLIMLTSDVASDVGGGASSGTSSSGGRRNEDDTHSMFARSTDMTDILILDDPFENGGKKKKKKILLLQLSYHFGLKELVA